MVEGDLVTVREGSIILCGSWAVLSERNARNHGEEGRAVMDSMRWDIDVALDLETTPKKVTTQTDNTKIKWEPPDAKFLKNQC